MTRRVHVRYEQAVYGSFPFWNRGYAILAHSPGCRPEWLAALRAACQRLGERPAGAAEAHGLFALRPDGAPWMIVGVGPQGHDDQGRPGALAFHALFVDPRDYLKAGAVPFDFAGCLRNDWTVETRTLASGTLEIAPAGESPAPPSDLRAARIASALAEGRRVALQTTAPIDDLARRVWLALPLPVRGRASVATWAFGNGNRFDLVALPRLAGIELDASYLTVEELERAADVVPPEGPGPSRPTGGGRLRGVLPWLGIAAFLLGAGAALALRRGGGPVETGPSPTASPLPRPAPDPAPPDMASYRAEDPGPEQRRRVTESLVDLAERFGVLPDDAVAGRDDPAGLMILLAEHLRYRGPWLSTAELAGLRTGVPADPGAPLGTLPRRDRDLALAWHAQTQRFAADRPLPESFARGPLRWQLDTLAWSFHLDDDPSARLRSPAEVVHALADALAVDVPLRETPLMGQSPTLAAYREFLGKLPRR